MVRIPPMGKPKRLSKKEFQCKVNVIKKKAQLIIVLVEQAANRDLSSSELVFKEGEPYSG